MQAMATCLWLMHGNVTHASCHGRNAVANEDVVDRLQDTFGDIRHDKLDSASDYCCAVALRDPKVQLEAGSCSE